MKIIKTGFLFLLGCVALSSCKKFLDVNTNPNTATVTNPSLVFTNALNVYAQSLSTGPNILGSYWGGYWAHSTSFTTGTPEKTYNFTNGDFNYWDGTYGNIEDFATVINTAEAAGASYLIGPSKIVEAIRFQELVDLYGNIPYTDAVQGLNAIQPTFDDAQTIYESLVELLTSAIADIKANPIPDGLPADIYCQGNDTKWIKFANSVKMRLLMRQSLISGRETYITGKIQEIASEGTGILGLGETIFNQPGYAKTLGKLNPFYNLTGYDQNDAPTGGQQLYRISAYLIDTLKATDDTIRLKYIAKLPFAINPTAPNFYLGNAADYKGIPFGGEGASYNSDNVSPVGPGRVIRSATATDPTVVFTASESLFLAAEAAQRFGITSFGSAQSLYESGIDASFALLMYKNQAAGDIQLDPSAASAQLKAGSASWDVADETDADKLNKIIYQKWVALADYNGLEGWSEFRRNDYPGVPLSVNSAAGDQRAVRLYYPQTEQSANPANVNAQGTIDVLNGRIFWDVN